MRAATWETPYSIRSVVAAQRSPPLKKLNRRCVGIDTFKPAPEVKKAKRVADEPPLFQTE